MEEAFQSDYKKRGCRWAGAVSLPPLPKDALVLETGCGNGKTLSAFSCRAVGVDISSEAVRLAGAKNAVAGDVRALPFSDSVFDAVFCWHVLGHLMEADRIKAVSELLRVTKPSGSVYFKAFSASDFRFGKGTEVEQNTFLRGDGMLTHYFSVEEVLSLFGDGEVFENNWSMRIRGVEHPRSEVIGIFPKNRF